jgi:hypothetical protein
LRNAIKAIEIFKDYYFGYEVCEIKSGEKVCNHQFNHLREDGSEAQKIMRCANPEKPFSTHLDCSRTSLK